MKQLHADINKFVGQNHYSNKNLNSKGLITNFTKGDFVLTDCDGFTAVKKLRLCWCGSRRIFKSLSNYVSEAGDVRAGNFSTFTVPDTNSIMMLR